MSEAGTIAVTELEDEQIIVGSGTASAGFTDALIDVLREAGVEPRTVPDPIPTSVSSL